MQDWEPVVVRAQGGDLEAYGRVVRRFQDMAYGYAYSVMGDFGLAEDAAQEAFVEAYQCLPSLREPAAFPSWLRRIMFKQCDRITRRKRVATVPLESAVEVASTEPGPAELIEQRQTREEVLAAIRGLPEHEREVTALFYINGYSHEDIAGFLGVPSTTVKSRLHTARKKLKERMVEMVGDSLREKALPETFTSNVLSNIPPLKWGTGKECTFVGALESALVGTDYPCTYETMMGVTGLAFRTRWFRGTDGRLWCGSSPVGEFPEEIEAARKATGWELRLEIRRDETGEFRKGVEEFVPDIVASINEGKPVLSYGPVLNMCVIHGYEDGGETLLVHDYGQPEDTVPMKLADMHCFVMFLGAHSDPLPPGDGLKRALQTAVRNWRREPDPHPKGHYLFGEGALRGWADDIGLYDELTDEQRGNLFSVSSWCFCSMADARVAAVKFLRGNGLDAPADLYQQEVDLFSSVFEAKNAFLGPCSGKSAAEWSADVRQREREILTRAREIEATAVAALSGS